MHIGRAVKELRIKKGINQSELAKSCGLTQTAVSQIESGLKRPSSTTMKKICDFFEIPELVIYLLATEESDIPLEKLSVYRALFPNIKNLLLDVLRPSEQT